jgi:hypothetical protein
LTLDTNGESGNEGREKKWAQDLILEEIGQDNHRLAKKWILTTIVVAVGVIVGVVLSQSSGSTKTKRGPPPTTTVAERFLSRLPLYSLEQASIDSSPQARALDWLQ